MIISMKNKRAESNVDGAASEMEMAMDMHRYVVIARTSSQPMQILLAAGGLHRWRWRPRTEHADGVRVCTGHAEMEQDARGSMASVPFEEDVGGECDDNSPPTVEVGEVGLTED